MRTDLKIPIIKVLSQTELTNSSPRQLPALQPDTDKFHTWQIAGAAHSDAYGISAWAQLINRDRGGNIGDKCTLPSRSRVPSRYVYNSAIDKLEKYIDTGAAVPSVTALAGLTNGSPPTISVDARGISTGAGIRLGEVVVPMAMLGHVDDATFWIASGYLNSDPVAARPNFRLAIASLEKYSALLDVQANMKTLNAHTVNYLKGQATTMITALGKL